MNKSLLVKLLNSIQNHSKEDLNLVRDALSFTPLQEEVTESILPLLEEKDYETLILNRKKLSLFSYMEHKESLTREDCFKILTLSKEDLDSLNRISSFASKDTMEALILYRIDDPNECKHLLLEKIEDILSHEEKVMPSRYKRKLLSKELINYPGDYFAILVNWFYEDTINPKDLAYIPLLTSKNIMDKNRTWTSLCRMMKSHTWTLTKTLKDLLLKPDLSDDIGVLWIEAFEAFNHPEAKRIRQEMGNKKDVDPFKRLVTLYYDRETDFKDSKKDMDPFIMNFIPFYDITWTEYMYKVYFEYVKRLLNNTDLRENTALWETETHLLDYFSKQTDWMSVQKLEMALLSLNIIENETLKQDSKQIPAILRKMESYKDTRSIETYYHLITESHISKEDLKELVPYIDQISTDAKKFWIGLLNEKYQENKRLREHPSLLVESLKEMAKPTYYRQNNLRVVSRLSMSSFLIEHSDLRRKAYQIVGSKDASDMDIQSLLPVFENEFLEKDATLYAFALEQLDEQIKYVCAEQTIDGVWFGCLYELHTNPTLLQNKEDYQKTLQNVTIALKYHCLESFCKWVENPKILNDKATYRCFMDAFATSTNEKETKNILDIMDLVAKEEEKSLDYLIDNHVLPMESLVDLIQHCDEEHLTVETKISPKQLVKVLPSSKK